MIQGERLTDLDLESKLRERLEIEVSNHDNIERSTVRRIFFSGADHAKKLIVAEHERILAQLLLTAQAEARREALQQAYNLLMRNGTSPHTYQYELTLLLDRAKSTLPASPSAKGEA